MPATIIVALGLGVGGVFLPWGRGLKEGRSSSSPEIEFNIVMITNEYPW